MFCVSLRNGTYHFTDGWRRHMTNLADITVNLKK
jgi:hypothetical protein